MYRTAILACGMAVLLAGSAYAQSSCESPAPARFDSRVFGGGGATVFDIAAQYRARQSGRGAPSGDIFVGSGAQPSGGGLTAGDIFGGLTAAAGVAATIQGTTTSGQSTVGGSGRPNCRSPEVACDSPGGCPDLDSLPLCRF